MTQDEKLKALIEALQKIARLDPSTVLNVTTQNHLWEHQKIARDALALLEKEMNNG